MDIEEYCESIKNLLNVSKIYVDKLSRFTSIGVGGRAVIVEPCSTTEAIKIFDLLRLNKISYFVLGNGTNCIIDDCDWIDRVFVLCSKNLSKYRKYNTNIVCEAGLKLMTLIARAIDCGLGGIESLFGIPGSVGGAVYMNAGSFGTEIGDRVNWVEVYDAGRVYKIYRSGLKFGYRDSIFQHRRLVILKVSIRLNVIDRDESLHKCNDIMSRRVSTQPYLDKSAGSVFRRYNDTPAPTYIESCGLKGLKIGGAQVSTKHCGFVVNVNNAKFCEVVEIIGQIQKTVYKKFAILLSVEPIILGGSNEIIRGLSYSHDQ